MADAIALGIVEAEFAHTLKRLRAFDEFSHGAQTQLAGDLLHRADHGLVDRVTLDTADKTAVDLDDIQRQMAQVGVGGKAAAEVIQRHFQAQAAQLLDPLRRHPQLAQRDHLGHFDAQLVRRQVVPQQLAVEHLVEVRVEQRAGSQVEIHLSQLLHMPRVVRQPLQQAHHHPAVDGTEKAVALGGTEKLPRADPLTTVRVVVAQQHFIAQAIAGVLQRHYRLIEQLEVAQFDGLAQAGDPLQLALMLQQHRSEEHTSELQSQSNLIYTFFFLMIRRPPRSTLFPYTRSSDL